MVPVALAAFALGAGAMWLVLGESHPSPAQSGATNGPAEPRAEEPPDVSHLAPADAATTLANWNDDRQNWPHAIEHYQKAIALGRDNPDCAPTSAIAFVSSASRRKRSINTRWRKGKIRSRE